MFYRWTATSSGDAFEFQTHSPAHYNLLTEGFLRGHLYLAQDPAPELLALPDPRDPEANARWRLHDASLYHGHYYLYFGPVPVLALYAPLRLLGGSPSPNLAAFIFAAFGYTFSCVLLWRLLVAVGAARRLMLTVVAFVGLGLGQFTPILLRRTAVYEIAITAAFCFFMAGLACLATAALANPRRPALWTVVAGLCFGLTMGCRPHLVLAVIAIVICYAILLRRNARFSIAELSRLGVPIAICGAALAWYNFARFGSIFEFGQVYQLTSTRYTVGNHLALRNLLPNLTTLLFYPPVKLPEFPYFSLRPAFDNEPTAGAFVVMPLLLFGFAAAFLMLRSHARIAWFGIALALAAAAPLLFVALTPNSNARYQLDYTPVLWVLALAGLCWVAIRDRRRWLRRATPVLIVGGCLWSAALVACLSIQGYAHGLIQSNPELFQRIRMWFEGGS